MKARMELVKKIQSTLEDADALLYDLTDELKKHAQTDGATGETQTELRKWVDIRDAISTALFDIDAALTEPVDDGADGTEGPSEQVSSQAQEA